MTKRDRRDYFKQRRAKLKAERDALEAKTKPPGGKALTETLRIRVSGDFLSKLDRRARAGLFEQSRSEFCRYILAQHLKRMAAAIAIMVGFTLAAGAHEPDKCQFARITWDMQDVLSTLGDANWRLSDVVSAETLPGPERLSAAYSAYKEHAEALGELVTEYLRCAEHVGLR